MKKLTIRFPIDAMPSLHVNGKHAALIDEIELKPVYRNSYSQEYYLVVKKMRVYDMSKHNRIKTGKKTLLPNHPTIEVIDVSDSKVDIK